MIFVYLIKKGWILLIYFKKCFDSIFIYFLKIYKLKERYLQVYKVQPNFIKNIYVFILPRKRFFITNLFRKKFTNLFPRIPFLRNNFWISSRKRLVYQYIKKKGLSVWFKGLLILFLLKKIL